MEDFILPDRCITRRFVPPTAGSVVKWAYFFGKDLLTFEYDNLEPFYLKRFIPRGKG